MHINSPRAERCPRITFVAPCVRPGADGVGDYSLGIALELVRLGCEVQCIGFGDFHEGSADAEWNHAGVRALNLTAHAPGEQRMDRLSCELARFSPDLVGVQYYWRGFRSGGGHGAIARAVIAGSGHALRLMMYHEALLDVDPRSRLRAAARSTFTAASIAFIHHWIRPQISNTTCRPNADALALLGIHAECVSVPANIECADVNNPRIAEAAARLRAQLQDAGTTRPFLALTFGRLAPDIPAPQVLAALEQRRRQQAAGRPGRLVSVGRCAYEDAGWFTLQREALALGWTCAKLGALPPEEVSLCIQAADIGFLPTPLAYLDKSGVNAAFVSHGLPVLLVDEALHVGTPLAHRPRVPQTFARIAERLAATAQKSMAYRAT